MTENELRAKLVSAAESWYGCKESDGTHKPIIDLYNTQKKLPRGYPVKYTDAWCSTYASAVAIKADMTDIIPTECGCEQHINLFKKLGCWVEDDAYTPAPGDYIFYDWGDGTNYATTDLTAPADHVGIVTKVEGTVITVIEGNMSNAVGYRRLNVNGRYIRGYGVPDYAGKAGGKSNTTAATTTTTTATPAYSFAVGDTIQFLGGPHRVSSTAKNAAGEPAAGPARISAISKGAPYPYHVIHTDKTSTVYGWVGADQIASTTKEQTYKVVAGDTLSAIAKKYGTTVKKLASYNGIANPNIIRVGQVIRIPK